MILPKKDDSQSITKNCKTAINVKAQMNTTVLSDNKTAGYKISTTTVKQQQKFQCRAQEFFNAFTTTEVFNFSLNNVFLGYFSVKKSKCEISPNY